MEEEKQSKTKYYLYIDECGDQNLEHHDPNFPIFTLCGILVPEKNLNALNNAFNELKMQIFGNQEIIIHSVDLRKWKDDFRVLRDKELRERFLQGITDILQQHDTYVIVSCTILKELLNKFCVRGEESDVYGLSLAYLLERSIFSVDNNAEPNPNINVIVEERGRKEDRKLLNYYNGLRNNGTKWVEVERFRSRISKFNFKAKKDNIIGLQIADLIAYPITTHLLYPDRENPAYEAFKHNIFSDNGRLLGQKVIPH
ncbi:DUF3800 domain-containing protein [uncultured Duncaniella sp.]|uniref:DUF3800 domain-containing protein n=1 Tax=uncultured Duncaniella sp. TaxID=2768039 RepID=UPI002675B20F|nr:DUF3800 domain-containing protein [uncultured Duncaniella sp.]